MALSIAVVDINEDIRDAILELMESYSWDARTYESGNKFLTELRDGQEPDCVVIDIHLPEMNGIEVLKELSSQNLKLSTIVTTTLQANHPLIDYAHMLGASVVHGELVV